MMKPMVAAVTAFLCLVLPVQSVFAWGRFEGGVHPRYEPHYRRDPVVVHDVYVHRRVGGCVGCGVGAAAVAGLVTGAIVGAAIAANSQPTTIVEEAPPPQPVMVAQPPYGAQIAALPPGCAQMNVNGVTYYQCQQYWYQPYMGGNGVYYTLVPAP